MAETSKQKPAITKRGKPTGGARYPRYSLKDAITWSNKLVSKTHLSPQPADIVFASVVSSKGATAEIKVSALKQFGLLDGNASAYFATEQAKAINAAPSDEKLPMLQKVALAPSIFKALFDTYHGDEITIAKLRQRASDLNVHPDKTANCISIYIATLSYAELVSVDGERITHRSHIGNGIRTESASDELLDEVATIGDEEEQIEEDAEEKKNFPQYDASSPRAIFNVNVNLDSSLDTEKLERQLALLKRFGAI